MQREMKTVVDALALVVALAMGIHAQEPLENFRLTYGQGAFVFQGLSWSVSPRYSSQPWFEGEVSNQTGVDWKEAYLLMTILGNDGVKRSFQVPISLGFHVGEKSGVTVAKPYPASALPIRSAEAQFIFGTERRQTPSRMFSGPVVKQKDCLPDFVAASALSGLALRKKFTELVEFGCVEMVDESYIGLAMETATLPATGGKSRVGFTEALLGSADPSNTATHTGWIQTDRIREGIRTELVEHGHKQERR